MCACLRAHLCAPAQPSSTCAGRAKIGGHSRIPSRASPSPVVHTCAPIEIMQGLRSAHLEMVQRPCVAGLETMKRTCVACLVIMQGPCRAHLEILLWLRVAHLEIMCCRTCIGLSHTLPSGHASSPYRRCPLCVHALPACCALAHGTAPCACVAVFCACAVHQHVAHPPMALPPVHALQSFVHAPCTSMLHTHPWHCSLCAYLCNRMRCCASACPLGIAKPILSRQSPPLTSSRSITRGCNGARKGAHDAPKLTQCNPQPHHGKCTFVLTHCCAQTLFDPNEQPHPASTLIQQCIALAVCPWPPCLVCCHDALRLCAAVR